MSKVLNYRRLREMEKEARAIDGVGYETGTPTPESFRFLLDLLNRYAHEGGNEFIEETLLEHGLIRTVLTVPPTANREEREQPIVSPHKFGE